MSDAPAPEEYVRRLRSRVRAIRARDERCWCGRRIEEHINGQRCTRWFPVMRRCLVAPFGALTVTRIGVSEGRPQTLQGSPSQSAPDHRWWRGATTSTMEAA
jgi:hypothetical protein